MAERTLGTGAVLHEADAKWLTTLADEIYGEGLYAKGIRLRKLVEQAEITQTCKCKIKDGQHWWGSDSCPECDGETKTHDGRFYVCVACLHQWWNSRPPDRPTGGRGRPVA